MQAERMAAPLSRDVKPNRFLPFDLSNQRLPASDRPTTRNFTGLPGPTPSSRKGNECREEESDDDLFRVPDLEAKCSFPKTSNPAVATSNDVNKSNLMEQPEKRRRSRNPVDKEYRRLKRLLRNRVSAQQARERKKVYVNDLEARASELLDKNAKLEEKISTLINENAMLRKVLMNARPKLDESEQKVQQDLNQTAR